MHTDITKYVCWTQPITASILNSSHVCKTSAYQAVPNMGVLASHLLLSLHTPRIFFSFFLATRSVHLLPLVPVSVDDHLVLSPRLGPLRMTTECTEPLAGGSISVDDH